MPTRLPNPAPASAALPRKRPLQSRAVATVAAIVEAAAHILEKDGLDGYSTNAIAERAGVSIGSLYQYFPNKDAITRALIARESQSLIDAVATVAQTEDWRATITDMIRAAVDHQLRRPRLARFIDVEESRLTGPAFEVDTASGLMVLVRPVIARFGIKPRECLDDIVADILTITRALSDAAGSRQEINRTALERRIRRAVFGYLEFDMHA
jgi:AcrR family transcriptional regulator